MVVPNTSIDDVEDRLVKDYLAKIDDEESGFSLENVCRNLNILRDGKLTLGGLLFFSKNPQSYRPAFCIKAVSFFGNDIEDSEYRDSEDITGTIPQMFERDGIFFEESASCTKRAEFQLYRYFGNIKNCFGRTSAKCINPQRLHKELSYKSSYF